MSDILSEQVVKFSVEGVEAINAAMQAVVQQLRGQQEDLENLAKIAVQSFGVTQAAAEKIARETLKQLQDEEEKTAKQFTKMAAEAAKASEDAAKAAADAIEAAAEKTRQAWARVGESIKTGLMGATLSVSGLAAAGLHASSMGEVLSFQMGQLSRVVGGLFTSQFQSAIDTIRGMTEWLRNLTDGQKETIATFTKLGVASIAFSRGGMFAGVGALVASFEELRPLIEATMRLFDGLLAAMKPIMEAGGKLLAPLLGIVLQAVEALQGPLTTALEAIASIIGSVMEVLQPIVDLFAGLAKLVLAIVVPALQVLAAVLRGIAVAIKAVVDGLKWVASWFGYKDKPEDEKKKKDHSELAPHSSGPESVAARFDRLHAAALRLGPGGPGEQGMTKEQKADKYRTDTLEYLKQINENTGGLNERDRVRMPIFGR